MNAHTIDRAQLRDAMTTRFSESELRVLCFDMGVNFEEVKGENLSEKVVDLIRYFERRSRLEVLVAQCRVLRPDMPSELSLEAGPAGAEPPSPANARAVAPKSAPAPRRPPTVSVVLAFAALVAVAVLGVVLLPRGGAELILWYIASAALVAANAIVLALAMRAAGAASPVARGPANPDRLIPSTAGGAAGGLLGGLAAGFVIAFSYIRDYAPPSGAPVSLLGLAAFIIVLSMAVGAAVGAWTQATALRSRQANLSRRKRSLLLSDLSELFAATLAGGDIGVVAGLVGGAVFGPLQYSPPDPALLAVSVTIGAACIVAGSLLISHRGAWAGPVLAVAMAIGIGVGVMAVVVWAVSALGLFADFIETESISAGRGALLGLPIGLAFGLGIGLQTGLAMWISRILDRGRFKTN